MSVNYCKIGGESYDVCVEKIVESFDIQHGENAGRTVGKGATMILDPLGTFIGHEVTFSRKGTTDKAIQAYDDLWNLLKIPRYDGIEVEMADGQKSIKYTAYVSTGKRELSQITKGDSVLWGSMTIKFTPIEAQYTPDESGET